MPPIQPSISEVPAGAHEKAGADDVMIPPRPSSVVADEDEASGYQGRGSSCLPAFGAVLRAFVVGCTREAL